MRNKKLKSASRIVYVYTTFSGGISFGSERPLESFVVRERVRRVHAYSRQQKFTRSMRYRGGSRKGVGGLWPSFVRSIIFRRNSVTRLCIGVVVAAPTGEPARAHTQTRKSKSERLIASGTGIRRIGQRRVAARGRTKMPEAI